MPTATELLYDLWYVAAPSGDIARGKTITKTLLGIPMLIGRGADGAVFAMRDFCPHRGIPLSYGKFDGTEIECCYHGWCFNTQGQCTKIPALTEDSTTDISRIKAQNFRVHERDGLIWIFVTQSKLREAESEPPSPPTDIKGGFRHVTSVEFPCNIDHAALGLMDPSHGSFVHVSWWWRTRRSIHAKEKKFAPHGLGFKMLRHSPSKNSYAYKILGGVPATEIRFELPGLRTEHITVGRHHVVLLTALTPIDERHTQLHQFMYATIPLINWLKPLLTVFGKAFIRQDLEIVKKQQEGLIENHPSLMLLGDADAQALWYMRLKKDYLEAQATQTPFENRIPEKTLRWRS